jgi:DNA-binding NarL/FixJ family response regulator
MARYRKARIPSFGRSGRGDFVEARPSAGSKSKKRFGPFANSEGAIMGYRVSMKIVVIDDHALVRDMLMNACRDLLPGSRVLGAADANTGLAVCTVEQPELIILDLALPDRDGLAVLDDLLVACPGKCKVIGLSGYSDEFTMHRVLRSKLHGFVDKKEQTVQQLAAAIAAVMANERYLSPAANRARLVQRNDRLAFNKILSAREQHLLGLFGRGLSNQEIAAVVKLSELTVRNHRCRTMAKLGLRTSAELVRYALEKGFIHRESLEHSHEC